LADAQVKLIEIYSGLYQRGATWKLPAEQKRVALAAAGVHTILNLTSHIDDDLVNWHAALYRQWPFADNQVPLGIDELIDWAEQRWRLYGPMLVHCNGGRNRASLVTALMLARIGFNPSAAIERVRERRPNALANPAFEKYILSR